MVTSTTSVNIFVKYFLKFIFDATKFCANVETRERNSCLKSLLCTTTATFVFQSLRIKLNFFWIELEKNVLDYLHFKIKRFTKIPIAHVQSLISKKVGGVFEGLDHL